MRALRLEAGASQALSAPRCLRRGLCRAILIRPWCPPLLAGRARRLLGALIVLKPIDEFLELGLALDAQPCRSFLHLVVKAVARHVECHSARAQQSREQLQSSFRSVTQSA